VNFAAYIALVDEHLGVDADRRGIERLKLRSIKNSLVDLQRYIPGYRIGHTKIFVAADLLTQGHAMLGAFPTGAVPSAFYIYSTKVDTEGATHENCRRNRLDFTQWIDRQSLICGRAPRAYCYAISPTGRSFMIHPVLNDETETLLLYDGLKQDFELTDEVPFPEEAAEASAAYAKWRILLDVDKRIDLSREQYAIWGQKRLALYREWQDTQSAEKAGDVDGQQLRDEVRTDIHGWGDLAMLPTKGFSVPKIVGFVNAADDLVYWVELREGVDESDPAAGVQRPEDFSPVVNPRVWFKI
jgi:hypothetical protein